MQNGQDEDPIKGSLLNQVYLRLEARRPMDRMLLRSTHLLTLAAELDEAVCDEKPRPELREYIAAIEYVAAELQAVCIRFDLEIKKWGI